MKLLLDTHCLIWALADAPELSEAARLVMARAEEIAFSEASVWEIGLKWRKGKIKLQPRRVFEQALQDGLRKLPLSIDSILLSCELRHTHGDPFDRLLYAQAKLLDYRLLSVDRTLNEFGAQVINPK